MASVVSDATRDFVLKGMERSGLDLAWIGGNDLEEEGIWKWADCTPWDVTFWAEGEPNNCCGGEDCLELHQVHHNKMWNDGVCGLEHGFACSKKICSGRLQETFGLIFIN